MNIEFSQFLRSRRTKAALAVSAAVTTGAAFLSGCGLNKNFSSKELQYTNAAGLGGTHQVINDTDISTGGLRWSHAGDVSFVWYDSKIRKTVNTQMDPNNVLYQKEPADTPPNSTVLVDFRFNTDEIANGGKPCNPNTNPCKYVVFNNDQPNAYLQLPGATVVITLTNSQFREFMNQAPTPPRHR